MAQATGDLLQFLAPDDILHPNKIERVENLKVATNAASQITTGGRWEAPTVALLRTIYDRSRLRDANDPR